MLPRLRGPTTARVGAAICPRHPGRVVLDAVAEAVTDVVPTAAMVESFVVMTTVVMVVDLSASGVTAR